MTLRGRFRISLLNLLLLALLAGAMIGIKSKWTPWVLQRRYLATQFSRPETTEDDRRLLLPSILDSGSEKERDGPIRIFEFETQTERTLPDHNATFSPDGKRIASICEDGSVRVWDAATFTCRATLDGRPGKISSVEFAPDSSGIVTTSEQLQLCLWDSGNGTKRAVLTGTRVGAFSPDSKSLVTMDDEKGTVWDAVTGAARFSINPCIPKPDYETCVAFSFDSHWLAVVEDKELKILDAQTGSVRRSWDISSSNTASPRIWGVSPDSQWLAVVDHSFVVRMFNLNDGSQQQLAETIMRADRGTFLKDNRYCYFVRDKTGYPGIIHDLQRNVERPLEKELPLSAGESITPMALQRGYVASSRGDDLSLWDVDERRRVATIPGLTRNCSPNITLSPTGQHFLAMTNDLKELWVWAVASGEHQSLSPVYDVCGPWALFSADGTTIVTRWMGHPEYDQYVRCRPEGLIGILTLPEFWVAVLCAGALMWRFAASRLSLKIPGRLTTRPV